VDLSTGLTAMGKKKCVTLSEIERRSSNPLPVTEINSFLLHTSIEIAQCFRSPTGYLLTFNTRFDFQVFLFLAMATCFGISMSSSGQFFKFSNYSLIVGKYLKN
jgi:hypothetical protein